MTLEFSAVGMAYGTVIPQQVSAILVVVMKKPLAGITIAGL